MYNKPKEPTQMPSYKSNVKKPEFIPKTSITQTIPTIMKSNESKQDKKISEIPIIKNNNFRNEMVGNKEIQIKEVPKKVSSYEVQKEKPKEEFPDLPLMEDSFFDENEIKDLNNYMESGKKNNWF